MTRLVGYNPRQTGEEWDMSPGEKVEIHFSLTKNIEGYLPCYMGRL